MGFYFKKHTVYSLIFLHKTSIWVDVGFLGSPLVAANYLRPPQEHDRKALAKLFNRIDKDGSGQLTLRELIEGLGFREGLNGLILLRVIF